MKKIPMFLILFFLLIWATTASAAVYAEDFEDGAVDEIWWTVGNYEISDGILHMYKGVDDGHHSSWLRLRISGELIYHFEADINVSSSNNQIVGVVLQWWELTDHSWILYQIALKYVSAINEFQATLARETPEGSTELGRASLGSGSLDEWYDLSITLHENHITFGINDSETNLFQGLYPYPDSFWRGEGFVHGHDAVVDADYYVDNIKAFVPSTTAEEIIGTWSNGIRYWDVAASEWTKMTASAPTGDITAGDFTGDGKADVASCWDSGLWYQDGDTLDWTKVSGPGAVYLTAGDVTGDGRSEIIGTWSSGIWYWDVAESEWTKMTSSSPTGDVTAGDFTGDGKADVASIWGSGLWYQDGDTLDWTKVSGPGAVHLTAGDVTGDGRSEIIGTWSSGIWYWDVAESEWAKMSSGEPSGDIAAGDFTGDGKADVASIWPSGLWYQNGDTLDWTKVSSAPDSVTCGDVTGN